METNQNENKNSKNYIQTNIDDDLKDIGTSLQPVQKCTYITSNQIRKNDFLINTLLFTVSFFSINIVKNFIKSIYFKLTKSLFKKKRK